jgi:predicted ATPase/class 3 adenylate cyclase
VTTRPASQLPSGTVTFLFTDIEGSTKLMERLGEEFVGVLDAHSEIVRREVSSANGIVVSTEGDSFFAVFSRASDGVAAALLAQSALSEHPWPSGGRIEVRMGLHTGEGRLGGDNYVGIEVNRAARISAAGHGGQTLISETTRALLNDGIPQGGEIRDMGRHRLRGLDGDISLYEVMPRGRSREFPPLRTAVTPTNLPAQSSVFLGRDQEVSDLTRLIDANRLVTLVGPGGTGKTRLGIHVASTLLDRFPGGVFFVPLDGVLEPGGVPAAISLALGLEGQSGGMALVVDVIDTSHTLLVLDNLEHLVSGAPMLGDLLARCPNLHLLVTSQVPLKLRSEWVYAVPPLGLPGDDSPDAVANSDAAQLLASLVRVHDPSFAVTEENADGVAAIVRRLDGLPLAIELAAARVRVFGLDGLRRELDERLSTLAGGFADASTRHRTLASAIAWSYDLMNESEQEVLRRTCVFAGGFGMDALQVICDPLDRRAVIDGIAELLDRSLVTSRFVAGSPRFSILETIKAFGLDLLMSRGEDVEVRRAHAAHYLSMVDGFAHDLRGPRSYAVMETMTTERANIDAALAWSARNDPDLGLSALLVLARYYEVAGSLDDGLRVAEQLLGRPGASPDARITGLLGAAAIAYWLLDYPQSQEWYEEGLALAEAEQDDTRIGDALFGLAYSLVWQGLVDEAEDAADRAMALFEGKKDVMKIMYVTPIRGTCQWMRGEFADSARCFGEVTEHARAQGDVNEALSAELVLAALLLRIGNQAEAAPYMLSVLSRYRDLGDEAGVIGALDYLSVLIVGSDAPTGLRVSAAVRKVTQHRGGTVPLETLGFAAPRVTAAQSLGPVQCQRLWEEGSALDIDAAVDLVNAWAQKAGIEPSVVDTFVVVSIIEEAPAHLVD